MGAPFPYAGESSAALSALCWAVGAVIFTRAGLRAAPGALNLGKNVVGVLCFAPLLWAAEGRLWPSGLQAGPLLLLALSGVVGLGLCDTLLLRSFLAIGPRRTNLFMVLTVPMVALLALLPPFGEHPPPLIWAGMGVCLLGIVLAVGGRRRDPVERVRLRRGARDALLAAFLQAVAVLLARWGFQAGGASVTAGAAIRLAFGTLAVVGMGALSGRLGAWRGQLLGGGTWRVVAVGSLVGTFLGIWTNQAGFSWAAHAGVAATLNGLTPVYLVPLSAAFLAEAQDARAWVSTLLATGGVALLALG